MEKYEITTEIEVLERQNVLIIQQLRHIAQKEAAARQNQINQQRAQLESQCDYVKGQAYLAPTRTGNFWESNNNAMAAYNNCMAGLPPPRSVNVICNRQGSNQIACFSQ